MEIFDKDWRIKGNTIPVRCGSTDCFEFTPGMISSAQSNAIMYAPELFNALKTIIDNEGIHTREYYEELKTLLKLIDDNNKS